MKFIRSMRLWAATLTLGAVSALGLSLTAASAPADSERGIAPTKTIKMVFAGGPPLFEGPANVREGAPLRILNTTKVQEIGPHVFSLVDPEALPQTNAELRQCGEIEFPLCADIAKAHGLNRRFVINRPTIERRQPGWDAIFTADTQGDSWYTEQKGDSETRIVSANAGTTLTYFCVVHPDTMRGSINVKPGLQR
jgi:hypothetical protein